MKVKPLQWDSTVEFGRGEILTWNFWLLSGGCPYCVCLAVSIVTETSRDFPCVDSPDRDSGFT